MPASYRISIPNPCPESWQAMTGTQRGAFCDSCQKEVIDFTLLTDAEIINYLQSTGAGCGRFRPSQLNRKLVLHYPHPVNGMFNRLRSWVAGSLVLLFTGLHFPLKAGIKKTPIETVNEEAQKDLLSLHTHNTISKTIRGIVVDEEGVAIPGVIVQVKGAAGYTQTGANGEFILKVPVGFTKKRIRIVARFIGYSDQELKIPVTSSQPVNIRLCMEPVILGGIAMITVDSGQMI